MVTRQSIGTVLVLVAAAILAVACPQPEPQVVEKIVTQVVEVEKVVEVERTVVVSAEVEVVVEQEVVAEEVLEDYTTEEPTAVPAMPAPPNPVLSFAVVHDSYVELFRNDGARAAVVDTAGPATVQFAGDEALVVDAQQARVFGSGGNQAGQGMPVSRGSTATFDAEHVAISHDTYVAIYSATGQPLVNIDTPVPVAVDLAGDLLALNGAGWTGVVHPDGRLLINVQTQGRAALHAVDGRLVLVDDATMRFFDSAGRPIGMAVDRIEPASVSVVGNRIVLAHPGWTEFFTPDGESVARIATAGQAAAVQVGERICLRDDGDIKLFDANGQQVAAAFPQPGDAEVLCAGDRLFVVHDDWVGVYSRSGESLANIATSGRGRLALGSNRLILADNEAIRLLSFDGQPVAEAIRLPGAHIQVVDGRLIATLDGQAATFDLNGAPRATIVTSGRPVIMPLVGGVLVVDQAQLRLLSPSGEAWMNLAALDSSTKVVSRE